MIARALFLLFLSVLTAHAEPPKPFTNGLSMTFVPVTGTATLFSIYETRVKDFRAFVRETGYVHMRENKDEDRMWSFDSDVSKQRGYSWEDPGFAQTDDHPVVGVSWNDAKAFCKWMTVRERAAGRLPSNWEYRLPSDHEWSLAAGLDGEDPETTAQQFDWTEKVKIHWGRWPEARQQPAPPKDAGKDAGNEAANAGWLKAFTTVPGYRDGFARTVAVGSFPPNQFGIFELGGNAWEWCEDTYASPAPARVLRGAAWLYYLRPRLLSSHRFHVHPSHRNTNIGFRCVVAAPAP